MITATRLLVGCSILLSFKSAHAAEPARPASAEIIARLKTAHPRLLATQESFASLKPLLVDPKVAPVYAALRKKADALLELPPAKYEIRDGKRLLYVSREVKEHVLTLGLLYRLTGEPKYAEGLWREMDAVAGFPDWNPKHFLDTAEMTFAVAIAYDWLYDVWTPPQRTTIREGLIKHGLQPALTHYRDHSGFAKVTNNWNQVCNGGILNGALAIADEEPALAGEILQHAIALLPAAMKKYAPDGAWAEGPVYWRYATEYNCYALAALQTALGTDYGLSRMPGFPKTGDAPLAFTGPLGLTFNYADAKPQFANSWQMFWLATAFNEPDYAVFESKYAKEDVFPLDLLWGAEWLARDPKMSARPLDLYSRADDVVYFRSAWSDSRALFVGFKGGDNRVSHGQLDLGSFVFDALGQRWAMDVGHDDYNRPGYFGDQRWTYYRNRAEGNNCFLINPAAGPDQATNAVAKVEKFFSSPERASAVVDLTSAYPSSATSARRGIALLDRKQVLIQDEVQAAKPFTYLWFMHTEAQIDIAKDGRSATLSLGRETTHARILHPPDSRFSVMEPKSLPTSPAEPPLAKNPMLSKPIDLTRVRKLTVRIENVSDLTVAVLLEPGERSPSPAIGRLAEWPTSLPKE